MNNNNNENCNFNEKSHSEFLISTGAKISQNQIFKNKNSHFVRDHHHSILIHTKVSFEHIHLLGKSLKNYCIPGLETP